MALKVDKVHWGVSVEQANIRSKEVTDGMMNVSCPFTSNHDQSHIPTGFLVCHLTQKPPYFFTRDA